MKKVCVLLVCLCVLLGLWGCGAQQQAYPVDADRIQLDTEYQCDVIGVRPTGTDKEKQTCDWLEGQLEQMGFSYGEGTLKRERFEGYPGLYSENLTAVCHPAHEGPIWCVVAHYDSIEDSPGARDNAVAVSILLEVARNLVTWQEELDGEVRLVFLGSEENGYHGSRAYLEGQSPQELDRHRGVINMDISAATAGEGQLVCCTLGGQTGEGYREGDFLEPADNAISRAVGTACKDLYGQEMPVVHGGESDHVTFHQWEIDCANVCWRRVEGGLPVLPPEYHGQDDVAQTIDYETARMTGRCVLEALAQLAGAER